MWTKDQNRMVKLTIYSKCLSFLLKDMKTYSFEGGFIIFDSGFAFNFLGLMHTILLPYVGITLKDPWGNDTKVFPRLFNYVVDNPEMADLWCTKQGTTKYACEICLCESKDFVKIGKFTDPSITLDTSMDT